MLLPLAADSSVAAQVEASEVDEPEKLPKVAIIPRTSAAFCLSSGDANPAENHWDNPQRRPFANYEISNPGACARQSCESKSKLTALHHASGTYVLSNGVVTRIEDDDNGSVAAPL